MKKGIFKIDWIIGIILIILVGYAILVDFENGFEECIRIFGNCSVISD